MVLRKTQFILDTDVINHAMRNRRVATGYILDRCTFLPKMASVIIVMADIITEEQTNRGYRLVIVC